MNFVTLKDPVFIDARGYVRITNRNMELLDIKIGALFYFGIDVDDHPLKLRKLLFRKLKDIEYPVDQRKVVEVKNYTGAGNLFYFNPVLNLLNITPPFECKFELSDELDKYNFSLILPSSKEVVMTEKIKGVLTPLVCA
jgi:hypothetical protein